MYLINSFTSILDMIKAGGLPILMKVQNMFGENLDICILLAKILSNVSLNKDCIQDIYQSGKNQLNANKEIEVSK